jgi:toxin-antitoxin system PIN domain toxin
VILLDANLLVYSTVAGLPEHGRTVEWLQGQLDGGMRVGLPWRSLLGFVRLSTNPRVFARARPPAEAWAHVRQWLSLDNVWIPQPTERHVEVLGDLLSRGQVTAPLVMDAHLAALAIEHGLVLCSNDAGFARFAKLRWLNPLEN